MSNDSKKINLKSLNTIDVVLEKVASRIKP